MAAEVLLPKLGLTMTDGVLSRWLVQDSDLVVEGQPILEIETDKALSEVTAPATGILRIVASAGARIPVAGLLAYVLARGEDMPVTPSSANAATQISPPSAPAQEAATLPTQAALASPAAKRRARELGVDVARVKGSGEGGRISRADVEAFAAGRPLRSASTQRVCASPVARRIAQEADLDLGEVRGSGLGGRVTAEDVRRVIAEGSSPNHALASLDESQPVPLTGVRAIIAERMLASARETAAVTLTTEVDATDLVNLRDQLNKRLGERLDLRVSYNDLLVKVAARALRDNPYMNARLESQAIRLVPDVNVGLAVDTERGLLVPVLHHADRKSLVQISRELSDMVGRALSGRVQPDELAGGTFTVTNLGAFGVDTFTPIINAPEVGILGVGRIIEKATVLKGGIVACPRLTLSLTFDHRAVDGAPAARFLQRIAAYVERPHLLMIDSAELGQPRGDQGDPRS